jgi:hypothetical protein
MGISAGVAAQLGWADSGTADKAFSFISESLRKTGVNIGDDGIRGTRSEASERIRASNFTIAGSISMQPNPAELVDILKWCGLSAAGTTYTLTEAVTSRDVTVDRVAKVFTYAGCYVNRATFSSSEGSPLSVTLDLVGKTETVANAATFPSLSFSAAAPFMHTDGTFSLVSSSRTPKSSVITIDNMLIAAFNNSQSAGFITTGGRRVSAEFTLPYSSAETDLYAQAVAGSAATITYAVGGYSLAFALASLQCPDNAPVVTNKNGEIVLQVAGIARTVSTTKELIVTFDSTA